jgi:hypothetical protein
LVGANRVFADGRRLADFVISETDVCSVFQSVISFDGLGVPVVKLPLRVDM